MPSFSLLHSYRFPSSFLHSYSRFMLHFLHYFFFPYVVTCCFISTRFLVSFIYYRVASPSVHFPYPLCMFCYKLHMYLLYVSVSYMCVLIPSFMLVYVSSSCRLLSLYVHSHFQCTCICAFILHFPFPPPISCNPPIWRLLQSYFFIPLLIVVYSHSHTSVIHPYLFQIHVVGSFHHSSDYQYFI